MRLLSSLRTLVPTARCSQPAVDNISLPSPKHQRPVGAMQGVSTHPTATAATLDVLPIAPQAAPSVQQPPLPDKVKQRIVKGEYIDFDMLLPECLYPTWHGVSPSPSFTLRLSDDPASVEGDLVIAQQKAANKRAIRDLPSWMEAWNVYIHVLVPYQLGALLAYQRIICDASVRFAPRCWLRYDQRFRASHSATTAGTLIKAYVNARPVASITSAQNVAIAHTASGIAPTPVAQQQLIKPIRLLQLERELANHHDKGFVGQLIDSIKHGCCISYDGPQYVHTAKHLPTAHTFTDVITASLVKECDAGRMAGSYPQPPLPNLHCSGLGVVPKKDGGWHIILSPLGASRLKHQRLY